MDKLLSIIIPAYNMEKYLHRCLDSIIVEDVMDKVQVIVVNDGSKDRTSLIAHEYEKKYPHYIQVIDKENGNYGSCMNVGLSFATGKYFRTLDADDWYDSENYLKFVESLHETDADMLVCERYIYYEDSKEFVKESFEDSFSLNEDINLDNLSWNNKTILNLQTVNCICYKTSILHNSNFRWTEKVFYSDTEYDFYPLSYVNKIRLVPLPVYCYFIGRNDQSVSPASIKKNFNSFYLLSKKILLDFSNKGNKVSAQYYLQRHHLLRILWFLYQSLLFDGFKNREKINEIEHIIDKIPEIKDLTSSIDTYRGHHYVDEYRNHKLRFYLLRLDFLIRTNRFLRKLL